MLKLSDKLSSAYMREMRPQWVKAAQRLKSELERQNGRVCQVWRGEGRLLLTRFFGPCSPLASFSQERSPSHFSLPLYRHLAESCRNQRNGLAVDKLSISIPTRAPPGYFCAPSCTAKLCEYPPKPCEDSAGFSRIQQERGKYTQRLCIRTRLACLRLPGVTWDTESKQKKRRSAKSASTTNTCTRLLIRRRPLQRISG
jgi:hypothetical protein